MTIKEVTPLDSLIIDFFPSMIFILEKSMEVFKMNGAARELRELPPGDAETSKIGSILNCINSLKHPHGCGKAPECDECTIRKTVHASINGEETVKSKFRIDTDKKRVDLFRYYSVSSNRIIYENIPYSLLVLEDVTELVTLNGFIPICASCKNIRNDKGFWDRIEHYIEEHSNLTFSHSICPECSEKMYPGLWDK